MQNHAAAGPQVPIEALQARFGRNLRRNRLIQGRNKIIGGLYGVDEESNDAFGWWVDDNVPSDALLLDATGRHVDRCV